MTMAGRRSYIQCRETGKLIPREEWDAHQQALGNTQSAAVHASFKEFKSPVDGSIISCPSKLREHNKRHGVTNVRDYGEDYFARRGKEKYKDMIGATSQAKKQRIETIQRAIHKHTR